MILLIVIADIVEYKINNMTYKRQQKAFELALWYCRAYGLNWKLHIRPVIENKEIIGYYVLDETKSTTVKTIYL
jgi:hypothetical protein